MVRPKQSIQSHRKDEHVFLAEKFHQDDRQTILTGFVLSIKVYPN